MTELTSTRKLFTLLSTCVEDMQPLIDCVTEKIRETEEYKEILQAVHNNYLLQQNIELNFEQKSLTELFDMYIRIKAILNARKILYRKMLYSNIEKLKNIPKPDFNNTNSVNAYIGHLNNLPETRYNITNISRKNAFAFYRDDTITDLKSEYLNWHFKIKDSEIESIIKRINSKGQYFCIDKVGIEERLRQEAEEKRRKQEERRIKFPFYTRICAWVLVSILFLIGSIDTKNFSELLTVIIYCAPLLYFGRLRYSDIREEFSVWGKVGVIVSNIAAPLMSYILLALFLLNNSGIVAILLLILPFVTGYIGRRIIEESCGEYL